MTKRMLIDAAHAEETRVAVVDNGKIEELDFEIAAKRQLRGNIYLAKVVRVEPSLQAAFVEYGGNRHGFLAFSDIHPDYFQIPAADREALLREAAEHHDDEPHEAAEGEDHRDDDAAVERELDRRRERMLRRYKIQEVVRRRQIMLVQVVKEERGNKGAALTTYLSLAGRYCVLMPNTARGGGISRKIVSATDRKRLKSAVASLDVPAGIGLIVRTAGASRTKAEIKRDYEYLLRMWETIRETTLQSIAPSLIYAEEDLVKRAVRDMFDKEFDSIQVEGEAGYKEARDFMRLIMPSQAKKVIHYKDMTPLFVRHRVEDQIGQIHSPVVPLRSGGYLVINQTEALVAIDVNSGRATRERNIEQTALKTNLEAAEEASRQLRLRDLAGLIVIDFIDMDEGKNNRAVEKVLKDCLKDDRARVQMGKISVFGLMEISRQRRRMGVLEGSTHVCQTCAGTGRIRSTESAALEALRAVELEAVKGGAGAANLKLPQAVALYVLNCKRAFLQRLEETHGLLVTVHLDDGLAGDEQVIERTESREGGSQGLQLEPPVVAPATSDDMDFEADDDDPAEPGDVEEVETRTDEDLGDARDSDGRGGRRRRRRGGRARADEAGTADAGSTEGDEAAAAEPREEGAEDEGDDSERGRRRRRGRRGGRRTREEGAAPQGADAYAWRSGGRVPEGADVYAWRDPNGAPAIEGAPPVTTSTAADDDTAAPQVEGAADVHARSDADAAAPSAEPQPAGADAAATAVEAEPVAAKPRRVRAPRRRKTAEPSESLEVAPAAEGHADAVAAASAEALTETSMEPVADAPSADAAPAANAPVEAEAPEPVAPADPDFVAEPEVVQAVSAPALPTTPPAPDPSEIRGAPAAPRRGWWRLRG